MSLLNEMLHDLDVGRRQSVEPSSDADSLRFGSNLLSSNASSTWVPALIAFAVVASLLIWQQLKPNAVAEIALAEQALSDVRGVTEKAVAAKPVPALLTPNYYPKLMSSMQPAESSVIAEVALEVARDVTLEAAPEPSNVEQELHKSTSQQQKIAKLLAAASKAFAQDRLLSPADDNASDRYRKVLSLAPNHAQAISGLESVAQRYINLALGYANEGNDTKAKFLLRRAEVVMPENASIRATIAQARADTQTANKRIAARQLLQTGPQSLELNPTTISADAPKTTVNLPQPQKIVSVRSDDWRDADAARRAKILLTKGRDLEALQNLRDYVGSHPDSTHALDVLLHGLIDRRDINEAQQWLSRAKHLSISDSTEYSAHILMASNNTDAAIALLESQLPEAENDFSYRVLLAGLYHQKGAYTQSVAAYTDLLREHGNKSEYWLGLAVGLDSLDRDQAALKAFISASDSTQNEQVQRYIAARIQALSS